MVQGYQPTLSPSEFAETLVPTESVKLTTHAAVTKGYVYAVDFTTIDATTGFPDTTIAVATAHGKHGVLVVAMENAASGAVAEFLLRGKADVWLGASAAQGAGLVGVNGQAYLDDLTTAGFKVVAKNLVVVGGSAALSPCIFNGVEGFGSIAG